MLYHGDTPVLDLRLNGEEIQCLLNAGRVVYVRGVSTADNLPAFLGLRIVEENGSHGWEKWFEVGLPVPATEPLSGNASAGWSTMNGLFGLTLEWSENLADWALGKFSDSGTPEAATIDGVSSLIHWARSMYPNTSATKTSSMVCSLDSTDSRQSPIIGITINSAGISLPSASYTMPGDAGQLQTDLRAAGFTGATVTASGLTTWEISLPSVAQSGYSNTNMVSWPTFWVPSLVGGPDNANSGAFFSIVSFNSAGVRTDLEHQFARLGLNVLKL